jgi:nucleoside-diphosphate-sugar epimerase
MKPTGQPRRILATNLAKEKFGFEAVTMIDEGLQETVKWYNEISRSAR